MDVSADILKNIPPETIVAAGAVFCMLSILGLAADVFLIVRFLTTPPPIGQWSRRLRARPWTWREFVLVAFSLVILHLTVAAFLYDAMGGDTPQSEAVLVRGMVLTTVALHVPAMLLVLYAMIRKRLSPARAFGIQLKAAPGDVAKGVLSYLAIFLPLLLATLAYMTILRTLEYDTQPQAVVQILMKTESPAVIVLLGFIAIVAAPIVEETIFRGIALPFFAKHMSIGSAIFLVSFLFAIVHAHIPAFVPIFLLAVGLSLGYIVTGSLTVPIIMHACFNALSLAAALVFKDVAG